MADVCPLADGGEGTLRMLVGSLGGSIERAAARDPLGREIEAEFALLPDRTTAIVEAAEASGLQRVPERERDAEAATSAGTGDLMVAARRAGATRILVGVGASACTDGGAGAIDAIRDGGGLDGVVVEVLCDSVTSFERAATVFGLQKGADQEAVVRLTARLEQIAKALPRDPRGLLMSGCAGGLSGGLWACFGALLRSGADYVLDAVGFDSRAASARRVVTGEGRLDDQTLDGKLVSVVARRAHAVGASVHAVVGQSRIRFAELEGSGLAKRERGKLAGGASAGGAAAGARGGPLTRPSPRRSISPLIVPR